MRTRLRVLVIGAVAALLVAPIGSAHALNADTLVTVGSPSSPFSANKQNEPAVAIDANHPNVLVAGANDNIDMEACNAGDDNDCPFTPGVGVSGVYFSFDGGAHWTQPTYTGLTRPQLPRAPSATAIRPARRTVGPIGTLPWYFESRPGRPTATRRWPSVRARRRTAVLVGERLAAVLREPDLELRRRSAERLQGLRGDRRLAHRRLAGRRGQRRQGRLEGAGDRVTQAELARCSPTRSRSGRTTRRRARSSATSTSARRRSVAGAGQRSRSR